MPFQGQTFVMSPCQPEIVQITRFGGISTRTTESVFHFCTLDVKEIQTTFSVRTNVNQCARDKVRFVWQYTSNLSLSPIKRFHSRGWQIYANLWKFIGTNEQFRKEFNSHRIGLEHQHGRCLFFWNINIATVTSCENTLFFHFPDCPSYKTFWKEKRAVYLNLNVHFIF